jgi:folate-binding protein YgfZ
MAPPATWGDVTGEYLALRREAGIVAGLHELVWLTGGDAVSFGQQMLSQDLEAMEPGDVARSFLLEGGGRLRSLLWLLRGTGRVGLVADAGMGPAVAAQLERFRFRVDVAFDADRGPFFEVWGPEAASVLQRAGLVPGRGWSAAGGGVVASLPLGPLPRYFVAGGDVDAVVAAGGRRAGALAATAVRIEAGEPLMGVDVDESTIPQETGLVEAAVSFTKGCYLGQELVARIDSRGRVNRQLRGVVVSENVLPPRGAEVIAGDRVVGRVGSVAESLELRAPIGLAMVRREIEPGAPVALRWDGGSVRAIVRELPLDDFDLFRGP